MMATSEELLEEVPWEERSLNLLLESSIDQQFSEAKDPKKGGKKHKLRWMKRPMAIPELIVKLLDEDYRENALRCLSSFLLERREEDPENYYRAGYLLYNSCATMTLLLQEVVKFYGKMVDGSLNVRSSKRMANVLTLFQSIAANTETRQKFVNSGVPNFLIPLVLFESPLEVFNNVRAVALSVIGILCQTREPKIIQWAVESNMVEVCRACIETGSELTQVIGMHILEAILRDDSGIAYLCSPICDDLLTGLLQTWEQLVSLLAAHQDFSPRLFFHTIRCYVLLCNHVRKTGATLCWGPLREVCRLRKLTYCIVRPIESGDKLKKQLPKRQGFDIVMSSLPDPIKNGSFHKITEEFPVIERLLHQLLVTIGESTDDVPEL